MNPVLYSSHARKDFEYPLSQARYQLLQRKLVEEGYPEGYFAILSPECYPSSNSPMMEDRKAEMVRFYLDALALGADISTLPNINNCDYFGNVDITINPESAQFNPSLTTLTGGTPTSLDSIETAGLNVGQVLQLSISNVLYTYQLDTGTTAESSPSVIRPDDYDATTNAKVWNLQATYLDNVSSNKTITAAGTTGAQTINKNFGSFNIAAGAGTAATTITDSRVTVNSLVVVFARTNDTTLKYGVAVPAAGSFQFFGNANATAETSIGFLVIN